MNGVRTNLFSYQGRNQPTTAKDFLPVNGDPISEDGAGEFLRWALGARRYHPTGWDSSESDGVVVLNDGSEIQLEVTRTMLPELAEAARAAERAGHAVQLDHGSGEWLALLTPSTVIKNFVRLPSDTIIAFAREHELSLEVENTLLDVSIKSFDLVALSGRPSKNNVLRFTTMAIGTNRRISISTHPDVIADFAEHHIALMSDPTHRSGKASKFDQLVERAMAHARQAHFAFVVQDTLDTGLRFALWEITNIHVAKVPRKSIVVPTGVDCVWIIRPDYQLAFSFSPQDGWRKFSRSQYEPGSETHDVH